MVWHIIVLSLSRGLINAFEIPGRQAVVVDMVDHKKKALASAIALNSTTFNLSRLIGPSVAGILISAAGEGWCFIINGISYGAVMTSLFLMRVSTEVYYSVSGVAVMDRLREGIRYISSSQIGRASCRERVCKYV